MSQKIIGIDLGGTSVKFAIVTPEGEIQDKWSIATNILDEGSHIVPDIIASIQHRLALLDLTTTDLLGIGMGSPGAIDSVAGTVVGAYNLNWKTTQPIKKEMEAAFGVPFFIDNDANVAALGEKWMGAGENKPDVIFLTLGTGVGGGVVAGGNLIRGAGGAGGEIGHMVVDFDQPILCTCGKPGCLETVASATGIVNLARRYAERYAGDSELKVLIDNGETVSAKVIFDLAKEGDALGRLVYENFSRYLGIACANMACLLNPSAIVIGGGVSAAGDFLIEGLEEIFKANVFPQIIGSTQIKLAELGNDAGIIGAASLVLIP